MPKAPFSSPIAILSASLRRERERMVLSVSELAKRAGVAKSTLSQIEAGIGNPGLETLWSLAMALEIQVTRLIAPARPPIQVLRAGEGMALASEQANYVATLLAVCPAGMQRDMYRLVAQPGKPRVPIPHPSGTAEHVVICHGRARVGPLKQTAELGPGDYASYPADETHIFEALVPDTSAVMLMEHP